MLKQHETSSTPLILYGLREDSLKVLGVLCREEENPDFMRHAGNARELVEIIAST